MLGDVPCLWDPHIQQTQEISSWTCPGNSKAVQQEKGKADRTARFWVEIDKRRDWKGSTADFALVMNFCFNNYVTISSAVWLFRPCQSN